MQYNKANSNTLHLQSTLNLTVSSQQPIKAGLGHGYNPHFTIRLREVEELATDHTVVGKGYFSFWNPILGLLVLHTVL